MPAFSLSTSVVLNPHWVVEADIVLVDRTVLPSACLSYPLGIALLCPREIPRFSLTKRGLLFYFDFRDAQKTSSCFPYAPDYTGSKLHLPVIYFSLWVSVMNV